MKFKNECDKLGGPPNCFSGFCDDYAECIDCPSGLVDMVIRLIIWRDPENSKVKFAQDLECVN
jgi:hypothetical protein